MQKTKTRMISIRVSADEYELVKNEYTSRGVRSVSEFTREALHNVLGLSSGHSTGLHAEIRVLDNKVTVLQGEVSRLSRIVTEGLLAKLND
jgi:hypothetical protein